MRIPELDRINELARLAKTRGLTAAELSERALLRRAYLDAVKGQINGHLSHVTVIDPDGNDVTPAALRDAQARNMQAV
ncbi:Uncharacterized protein conserved in bacteria [Kingella potus]|uniref:Uncharacterized protein conserved in bacteria n=1 Tax=Kingella potus TaxID=265175 RepID=A0A377R2I2_9NEIS|nr:DUF896 domain-containing protein [Kingella potus]UOP00254.1 DUF896 domain-containing protein [Kingella potus]STR02686.1 Uncharacterized protein conserved in bacteria [Kingella potus]